MPARFSLGRLVATPGALEVLAANGESAAQYLSRHVAGDYGDVCEEDKRLNDEAIKEGSRILSAYSLKSGERLFVISEADRSSTCVLLSTEY